MNILPPMSQNAWPVVGVGVSDDPDPGKAVRGAAAQIDMRNICFVLVFVPDRLEHEAVARALNAELPTTSVFGCTTAGQITPRGYEDSALMLVAFPREHFRCSSALIEPLNPVSIAKTAALAKTQAERFQRTANWNRFALIIADGLSKQEDVLVAALEVGLEKIPVFGGSAGHGLAYDATFVLHDGKFHSNAAVLVLVETDLEFAGLGFDHFLPTETRMVVTRAIPEERIVEEINGTPAAVEYARLVGCRVEDLSPIVFAENPVLVRHQQHWYVRAIQQVVDGQSLSFLSAIDNGLLLTLGRGREIIRTLETGLSVADAGGNLPEFILGFDCVLRRLEIEQKQLAPQVSEIFRKRRVLGFNTYGEQHRGVHVNQTFVGVAFYPAGKGVAL